MKCDKPYTTRVIQVIMTHANSEPTILMKLNCSSLLILDSISKLDFSRLVSFLLALKPASLLSTPVLLALYHHEILTLLRSDFLFSPKESYGDSNHLRGCHYIPSKEKLCDRHIILG